MAFLSEAVLSLHDRFNKLLLKSKRCWYDYHKDLLLKPKQAGHLTTNRTDQ